ncbi:histone protein [Streptomyces sp. NBC_01613]|uniref:histone protein n=1 Tax=Streptomyces sp. NBC_01613 TaxID=2975896 RepID=UPI00386B738D
MSEPNKAGLAAALAGGYVLGRTKKGRMALTAAALLLGRSLHPRELVAGGIRKIGGIPQDGESGEQDPGDIVQAGREVVSAVANRRLTAFTTALHERTLSLNGETDEEAAEDTDGEPEEEYDEEAGEEADEEAAEDGSGKPSRQRSRRRDSGSAKQQSAAGKNAPKKKAEAKGPQKKSSPARKPGARKSASAKKSTSQSQREG